MSITLEGVRSYLYAHPAAECRDIAKAFSSDPSYVAARMKQMLDVGYVVRNPVRMLPSNVPVYGYTATKAPFKGRGNRTGKSAGNVPKSEENVSKRKKLVPLLTELGGLDSILDSLAQSLAQQVVGRIKAHIANEITSLMPETLVLKPSSAQLTLPNFDEPAPLPAVKTSQTQVQAKRKKVCIFGLIGHQAGIISSDFANCFDFKFITADECSHKQIKAADNYDAVLVMGGFISHATTNSLKAQGIPYSHIPGGVTMLREKLRSIYA